MIAVCAYMVAEGPDSDRESPAYGAGELPFLYPAIFENGQLLSHTQDFNQNMKGNENRHKTYYWCQWVESNHRPSEYESEALTY